MNSTSVIILITMVLILLAGNLLLTRYLRATPEKFMVASTIFSILWVGAIVVAFSLTKSSPSPSPTPPTPSPTPTPSPPTPSPSPPTPGPSSKYTCNKGSCVVDPNGTYVSLEDCTKSCKADNPVLDVEYLTIEYNPNDYTASDTISPWFNDSIKMMGKGDVAVLMTDYMNIHDTILDNMKTALQKGAKFVLGADRWYICGDTFTCDGSNECPSTDCTSKNPKPDNCYCNIPQAAGCDSFNKILTTLDYCSNKDNIILIDQPSNKDDNNIWGHAHRKIVNFYYKNSNKARMICGSWNIDADLNRQNLGVKETSLGIATQLSDGFAQYMLQIDIDTLTPIITYEPTVAAVASNLLPILTALKVEKGYPKLPLSCTVNWTDNTPGYNPSKGTDNNVEIWLGISPPPVNPANEFTSPKGVVYGDNSPPEGDDNWQDQYKDMVQKSKLCTKNGTGDNGDNTFASYCTQNGKVVSLDFATGGTWSGLLFQKFFDESNSSPFINVSMYIGFDIGAPCDYLSGTWGWGCSGGTYHGAGWYQHQFPLLFPAIRDYVSNTDSSIRILTGEYNSTNDSGWTPWIWDTAFPTLTQDEQKRIHWKWFNQGRNGEADLTCANDCGPSRCCRNHEKLYMSDDNILVSSGHPERGYYSDINGVNNDILFLKAKGLAGVFNTHFKTQWQKQGVTINSKTNQKQACTNKDGSCWINSDWDIYTTPVSWQS